MPSRPAITTKGYHRGRTPANKGLQRYPAEVLTPDEVRALLAACSNRAPTGVRNRALIAVLYRGGLRLGKRWPSMPKDLDPVQGTITVLHGKGDRRGRWASTPEAMALVLRWAGPAQGPRHRRRRRLFCTWTAGR